MNANEAKQLSETSLQKRVEIETKELLMLCLKTIRLCAKAGGKETSQHVPRHICAETVYNTVKELKKDKYKASSNTWVFSPAGGCCNINIWWR